MAPRATHPGPPEDGLRIVCPPDEGRAGDRVGAYVGDDPLGEAALRRRNGGLVAWIALAEVAPLSFPAAIRVANLRTGRDIGPPRPVADAAALIQAAGAPSAVAQFAGLHPEGPAFTVALDRLAHYSRSFELFLDGQVVASACSIPGNPQRVAFELAAPIRPGMAFRVVESRFGVVALAGRFDATRMLSGTMAQLARLEGEVAALRAANAQLRRRLDTAIDLGRDRLLLDRLDLFYLLLCERIDPAAAAAAPATPPATRHFGPADIDGIGIFEVETHGEQMWRWVGPDATIALRDIAWPVRRVTLYFHGFGQAAEPPLVRVSTGGPAEWASPRALEGRYAVEVAVPRDVAMPGRMLILHLSFDRHETSDADPRLRAAVFSGADVMAASP